MQSLAGSSSGQLGSLNILYFPEVMLTPHIMVANSWLFQVASSFLKSRKVSIFLVTVGRVSKRMPGTGERLEK